jgi:hypothetical protein
MTPPHVVDALRRRFAELKAQGSKKSYMVSLKD